MIDFTTHRILQENGDDEDDDDAKIEGAAVRSATGKRSLSHVNAKIETDFVMMMKLGEI